MGVNRERGLWKYKGCTLEYFDEWLQIFLFLNSTYYWQEVDQLTKNGILTICQQRCFTLLKCRHALDCTLCWFIDQQIYSFLLDIKTLFYQLHAQFYHPSLSSQFIPSSMQWIISLIYLKKKGYQHSDAPVISELLQLSFYGPQGRFWRPTVGMLLPRFGFTPSYVDII